LGAIVVRSAADAGESRSLDRTSASAGASINVGAVVDRDDLDYVPFLIDPINDQPVLSARSRLKYV
jgi:methylglyoxal synthase